MEWVAQANPDIVLLQELKTTSEIFDHPHCVVDFVLKPLPEIQKRIQQQLPLLNNFSNHKKHHLANGVMLLQ